jgi:hypothetical protein
MKTGATVHIQVVSTRGTVLKVGRQRRLSFPFEPPPPPPKKKSGVKMKLHLFCWSNWPELWSFVHLLLFWIWLMILPLTWSVSALTILASALSYPSARLQYHYEIAYSLTIFYTFYIIVTCKYIVSSVCAIHTLKRIRDDDSRRHWNMLDYSTAIVI